MRRGLWSTLEGRLQCTEQWQFRLKRSLQRLQEVPVTSVSAKLEQYATPPALAAKWITCLRLLGDIDETTVVQDIGCGAGTLGLAAVLAGARRAILIDCCQASCEAAQQSAKVLGLEDRVEIRKEFVNQTWTVDSACSMILTNPPFGHQTFCADRVILDALANAPESVRSCHVLHARDARHVYGMFRDARCWQSARVLNDVPLTLPKRLVHHRSKSMQTYVHCWRMVRQPPD
mmetsp:Transcript_84688/g.193122  ORF Transcript_84688/g.193122 Transcript_84688/m.193122 type:complete len:232 (-) Transcript_84688:195-890(-)